MVKGKHEQIVLTSYIADFQRNKHIKAVREPTLYVILCANIIIFLPKLNTIAMFFFDLSITLGNTSR